MHHGLGLDTYPAFFLGVAVLVNFNGFTNYIKNEKN